MSRAYTPTRGMILALHGHPHAAAFDVTRCRLRGLMDHRQKPTLAGRELRDRYRIREVSRG